MSNTVDSPDQLLQRARADMDLYFEDETVRIPNEDDRDFFVRCALATFAEWLHEDGTEVELAAEMVKDGTEEDLSNARAKVRDVCDLVYEAIYRRTGWVG